MEYPQKRPTRTFCIDHLDKNLRSEIVLKDRELINLDNPDRAIEVCSVLINSHPENASAYLCRGDAYIDLGRFAEAISDFNKGIGSSPGIETSLCLYADRSFSFTRKRNFREALSDLKKLITLAGEAKTDNPGMKDFWVDMFKAYAYTQRGYIHLCLWDLNKAIADCTDVIKSFRPSLQIPAHNIRVSALMHLGRFDEAEKDCREVLSRDAENDEFVARTNLAWILLRRKDYDSAAKEIMQALKEDPQHLLTKTNLGDLLLGLNCKESAVEQYTDVLNPIYDNEYVDIDDYLVAIHVEKRLGDLNGRKYTPDYQQTAAEKGFIPLEISNGYLKFIQL